MRPFYLTVTTLVPGLFTSMVLLVLADVASPTFNVEEIPALTGSQAVFVFVIVLTVSFALGIVMHTISRGLFHKQKQQWTLDVLASGAVEHRLATLGKVYPSPGGPSYAELWEEAEEIAAIADSLLLPAGTDDFIERHREDRAPGEELEG